MVCPFEDLVAQRVNETTMRRAIHLGSDHIKAWDLDGRCFRLDFSMAFVSTLGSFAATCVRVTEERMMSGVMECQRCIAIECLACERRRHEATRIPTSQKSDRDVEFMYWCQCCVGRVIAELNSDEQRKSYVKAIEHINHLAMHPGIWIESHFDNTYDQKSATKGLAMACRESGCACRNGTEPMERPRPGEDDWHNCFRAYDERSDGPTRYFMPTPIAEIVLAGLV